MRGVCSAVNQSINPRHFNNQLQSMVAAAGYTTPMRRFFESLRQALGSSMQV
jgi:hypothetical protein